MVLKLWEYQYFWIPMSYVGVSLHCCHMSNEISTILRSWVQGSQKDKKYNTCGILPASNVKKTLEIQHFWDPPGLIPDPSRTSPWTLPECLRKRYVFLLRPFHKIEILGQIGPGRTIQDYPRIPPRTFPRTPPRTFSRFSRIFAETPPKLFLWYST